MSTIAVTNVKHPSAVDPALVLDADGDVTYAGVHDFSAATVTGAPQGLVHIATESFSAVSSVSLNGVFTSAYENYRIVCNYSAISATLNVGLRLRVSGVDATTNYVSQRIGATGVTTNAAGDVIGTDEMYFGSVGATQPRASSLAHDIFAPNIATPTAMIGAFGTMQAEGNFYFAVFNAHTTATAYDGFSLITSTGNMTGTIRVYGYANS